MTEKSTSDFGLLVLQVGQVVNDVFTGGGCGVRFGCHVVVSSCSLIVFAGRATAAPASTP